MRKKHAGEKPFTHDQCDFKKKSEILSIKNAPIF